jgi:hypothetical protein
MTADDVFFAFVLAAVAVGSVIVAVNEFFRRRNSEPPRRH